MSSHKYHVTIEDCIDEDERQYQQQRNQSYAGNDEIDVANINSNSSTNEDMSSRGSKRQAWEEIDALEEQARSEKIHDQATARANANEVADIVMEAQQSSGN